jgi:hypothetical protein
MATAPVVEGILRARLLVASLGESAAPPWWRSAATRAAGRRMLERLYPRTAVSASLQTAGRAARIQHDARIGKTGAYHLFRLPVPDEAALRVALRDVETVSALAQLADVGDAAARLEALASLAGQEAPLGNQGPVRCGSIGSVRRTRTLRQLCATYVAGFSRATPVFPYLTEDAE